MAYLTAYKSFRKHLSNRVYLQIYLLFEVFLLTLPLFLSSYCFSYPLKALLYQLFLILTILKSLMSLFKYYDR